MTWTLYGRDGTAREPLHVAADFTGEGLTTFVEGLFTLDADLQRVVITRESGATLEWIRPKFAVVGMSAA